MINKLIQFFNKKETAPKLAGEGEQKHECCGGQSDDSTCQCKSGDEKQAECCSQTGERPNQVCCSEK